MDWKCLLTLCLLIMALNTSVAKERKRPNPKAAICLKCIDDMNVQEGSDGIGLAELIRSEPHVIARLRFGKDSPPSCIACSNLMQMKGRNRFKNTKFGTTFDESFALFRRQENAPPVTEQSISTPEENAANLETTAPSALSTKPFNVNYHYHYHYDMPSSSDCDDETSPENGETSKLVEESTAESQSSSEPVASIPAEPPTNASDLTTGPTSTSAPAPADTSTPAPTPVPDTTPAPAPTSVPADTTTSPASTTTSSPATTPSPSPATTPAPALTTVSG